MDQSSPAIGLLMDLLAFISACLSAILSLILPALWVKNIGIFFKTLPRDLRSGLIGLKILSYSYLYQMFNVTAISRFKQNVKKHPNKPCFIYQDKFWTFKEVDEYSNKVALVFLKAGFKKGDIIALYMGNCIEYPCLWFGLAKIGVVTALINSNLENKPLIHSITSSNSKAIIFSEDLVGAVNNIRSELNTDIKFYQLGSTPRDWIINLNNGIQQIAPDNRVLNGISINQNDHLVYVFTSGTTGLPKAAIIPHSRFMLVELAATYFMGLKDDDIVYNPLPLYHTAGGLLGVGSALAIGGTVVFRTKFSASAYIDDCVKYKCTVGQYIGEICRYVLAVKEKPTDKQHSIRLMVGNGLRPAIWKAFVKKFGIPNIREVYGSTEGNISFTNIDNKVGAVGSLPRFLPFRRFIGAVIRVNSETMEPIRGPEGFCIECEIDEVGMFVGLIPNKDSVRAFHGYLDKKESQKKYIYNVFRNGDKAFVSGDLVEIDEEGYIYFKDRTGDTFRWKGENVATSEVEAVISLIVELRDCVVYGVQIGDLEGRAGMAAIVEATGTLDFNGVVKSLNSSLPKYAQPVFIRLLPVAEMTGTYKLMKTNLVKEGFDVTKIKDPIFVRKGSTYVPLTKELQDLLVSGAMPI